MTVRQNVGTSHFRWMLTDEPYKPNVEVSRRYWPTVSVTVSSNGFQMGHELTPDEAREMAAALFDTANLADIYEQERRNKQPGGTK